MAGTIVTETTTDLSDIVEVESLHTARRTNHYLKAGYRLLMVANGTQLISPEKVEGERTAPWVRRYAIFIVGRTADVPHLDYEDAGGAR